MKVATLSESAADEAAIRVLVNALLGLDTGPATQPRIESRRGWPNVKNILEDVITRVYYGTDAAGLVVVVDANGTPLQETQKKQGPPSRLAELRAVVHDTRRNMKPRAERPPFGVAIGVAAPAIEAWYLCGDDPHATEVAWERDRQAGVQAPAAIRKLKVKVYGSDRVGLAQETECAVREANRLAQDLGVLETAFPIGFGTLASAVRGWRDTAGATS